MSLDLSEKSENQQASSSASSKKSASVSALTDNAIKDDEPVFKSESGGKLKWFKYPLILVALGLIFTALILENPDGSPSTQTSQMAQSGQGLLLNQSASAGGDSRTWLAGWRKSSGGENLEEAYEKAEAYAAAGNHADAYILYFYAARKGHGSAALKLGSQSDPQMFSEEATVTGLPEPFVAYKWYKIAAATGVPEAATRLSELKEWVQTAAANGDVQADRLLLQWR